MAPAASGCFLRRPSRRCRGRFTQKTDLDSIGFTLHEGLKTNIFVKSTRVVISLYVWQYVQFLTQVFQRLTVANIKSAIKRIDIAERNRLRNKSVKSAVRTLMKSYFTAVDQYKAEPNSAAMEEVQSKMSLAYQKIDKAVQKGVLHKNNGAHKKSRLASALKPAT
jgi:small subunit ribosomal protein S20